MNTISVDSRAAITVFDADVAASATVHGNAFANTATDACAIELHVTLQGAPPAALTLRTLGQIARPAADTDRLLPLNISVPSLGALSADYTGVFVIPTFTPFNQIEIQNTGSVPVHVTAYASGTNAEATADDSAANVSSGGIGGGAGGTTHQASSGGALVAQAQAYASPCVLDVLSGYNADTVLRYVQIHNKASAISPGDVPLVVIPVPGNRATFSIDMPLTLSAGLSIGISSTELTYTSAGSVLSYAATVLA